MKLLIQITACFLVSFATLGAAFSQQYNVKYFFNENFEGLPITDSYTFSLNDMGQVALQVSTHPTSPIRYQQAIYSSANGYQALGLLNDGFTYNYINSHGVVVGTNEYGGNQSAYRYQNGNLEIHDIGYSNPWFLGLNNQGVAYGADLNSGDFFWTDFHSSQTVTVDGQTPLWVFGMSDDGLMGLRVGNSFYLHPILSGEFQPLVLPENHSFRYHDSIRMTDGGFITGSITNLVTSEHLYAAWKPDGSFDRILGPEGDVPYAIFNDLGHAVGLTFDRQPMYFDATAWKNMLFDDLQGGQFSEIFDFNNQGDFVGGMFNVPNSRPGYWTGFYASIVPEPSSAGLMTFAMMFSCFYRRGLRFRRDNNASQVS